MEGKKSEAADRIGFGTITQVSFVVCSILLFAGLDAAGAAIITVSGSTSTDIQNAVNKASSGDAVFIPAGWYKYTEQIYVATPNLLIKGVGFILTILLLEHIYTQVKWAIAEESLVSELTGNDKKGQRR